MMTVETNSEEILIRVSNNFDADATLKLINFIRAMELLNTNPQKRQRKKQSRIIKQQSQAGQYLPH
jgi:hypothetical protein